MYTCRIIDPKTSKPINGSIKNIGKLDVVMAHHLGLHIFTAHQEGTKEFRIIIGNPLTLRAAILLAQEQNFDLEQV